MFELLRMTFDIRIIKFIFKIHNIYKQDKNYSPFKILKASMNALKGEKIVYFNNQYIITSFLPPIPSKAFITHLIATPEKENIFTQQTLSKKSAPVSFYISLTNKCEYNCIHCSAKNTGKGEELTTEEWLKVIKDMQDMGTSIIGFTGGEPLLRDDLEEIINSIDDRSMTILFTTGKGLTLERAKSLKKKGLFAIGISLDSYIEEKHNKIRKNKDAFSDALLAFRNASKAGLYTIAQKVVFKEEIANENAEEELFNFFKFAKSCGAQDIRLLEPIRSGTLLINNDDTFYSEADRTKLREIQYKANKKNHFPKITTFAHTESEEQYGCGAGTQHSYISASGELLPCDFVPLSFGNVKEKSIKELWLEMNEIIGLPKSECFAMKIYRQIKEKGKNGFPINKKDSIEICLTSRANKFPKVYRILQGE